MGGHQARRLILAGADRTDRLHYPSTEICDPRSGRFTPGDSIIIGGYSDDNRNTAGVWRFTR